MYILGIESSCDDTCIGIIKENQVLANIQYSHWHENEKFGGIVPEVCARQHVNHIDNLLQEALKIANITMDQINIIGVTVCPGLQGGLLVGGYFAYTLSKLFNIPLIPVHHLEAHLLACDPQFPCDVFILSGGHTMLVRAYDFFNYEIIGETLDDSMGEYLDKVGRQLNLPFPAGKYIENYYDNTIVKSPLTMPMKNSPNFSFSGLKTQTIEKIPFYSKSEICTFMLITIGDIIEEKIKKYIKYPIVMGGGVTANNYIRNRLKAFQPLFPPKHLSTDNGVMVAKTARYYKMYNCKIPKFNILPVYSLEDWKKNHTN